MAKSKATAVASFLFSLAFWIPLVNLIFGALAIYLGIKALAKIRKDPSKHEGKGFAIMGIILGTLPMVLYLIGLGICFIGYKEVCKSIGIQFLA